MIAPGPKAARRAEEARTRLQAQVDERSQSRTNTMVNKLLDEHLAMSWRGVEFRRDGPFLAIYGDNLTC